MIEYFAAAWYGDIGCVVIYFKSIIIFSAKVIIMRISAKKAGYTQETFAEQIGRSVNFLAQVEGTGTVRGISFETLFKISDCLDIPPSKLLEDD